MPGKGRIIIPDAVKKAVVKEYLTTEKTGHEVAEMFGVSVASVNRWSSEVPTPPDQRGIGPARPAPKKKKKKKRVCLRCDKDFMSEGIYNRTCPSCRSCNADLIDIEITPYRGRQPRKAPE